MRKSDYIILGAGASGLMLAYRMAKDSFFDDKRIVRVLASDDDYCQVHTCKMCNVSMAPQEVSLPEGDHTLRIEISTIDHEYHLNAYFRIEFSIKQADVCKSCECPPPPKPTAVQRPPRPTGSDFFLCRNEVQKEKNIH